MQQAQHPQHGYVLLLTLVMVALVAAGTMGLTRASLTTAVEAKRAEQELQRRWAILSCRRVLLEQASSIFEQKWQAAVETSEGDGAGHSQTPLDRESLRVLTRRFTFGDLNVVARLSDEQAKLNVNALLVDHDPTDASSLVDTVLIGSAASTVTVALMPTAYGVGATRQVTTLERVFKGFDPRTMFDDTGLRPNQLPIDALTCWGDTRLRLALGSEEALRLLLEPHLDTTRLEHLIELRDERPDITVDQAIRALSLSPTQSKPIRTLLTDQSACYSLWITVESKQRTSYSLSVHQVKGSSGTRDLMYLW